MRLEFDRLYVVGEADPGKATDAKRMAFKRALDKLLPADLGPVRRKERTGFGGHMKAEHEIVTVPSGLHGERTFRRVGSAPYRRADGTETFLAVWQGTCAMCGAPFEITTPKDAAGPEQSKAFWTTTCKAHRLTPPEEH